MSEQHDTPCPECSNGVPDGRGGKRCQMGLHYHLPLPVTNPCPLFNVTPEEEARLLRQCDASAKGRARCPHEPIDGNAVIRRDPDVIRRLQNLLYWALHRHDGGPALHTDDPPDPAPAKGWTPPQEPR